MVRNIEICIAGYDDEDGNGMEMAGKVAKVDSYIMRIYDSRSIASFWFADGIYSVCIWLWILHSAFCILDSRFSILDLRFALCVLRLASWTGPLSLLPFPIINNK